MMPKPVLQAMVLADHVYRDGATGKHIIAGTFTTLFFHRPAKSADSPGTSESGLKQVKGPITKVGSPYLYLALVEVHGKVPLQIKFVDLSDAEVLMEANFAVACRDPVTVAEYVLPMPVLPTKEAGDYSLDLLYEGELLGSWRVTLKESENKE